MRPLLWIRLGISHSISIVKFIGNSLIKKLGKLIDNITLRVGKMINITIIRLEKLIDKYWH